MLALLSMCAVTHIAIHDNPSEQHHGVKAGHRKTTRKQLPGPDRVKKRKLSHIRRDRHTPQLVIGRAFHGDDAGPLGTR